MVILQFMASNCRENDARNHGRRGLEVLKGRALSASRTKSREFAEIECEAGRGKDGGCAEKDCENNEAKMCDISFKLTSNGGRGGQQSKAGAQGASLLKELQFKKVAKNIDSVGNPKAFDISVVESSMEKPKESDISFKPASSGGCGGENCKAEDEADCGANPGIFCETYVCLGSASRITLRL